MKRFIHIIVAALLLISTTGFTISKHYCGGELVEVAIDAPTHGCSDMEDDDCCKDESEFYQLTDEFSDSQILNIDFKHDFDISLMVIEPLELESINLVSFIYFDKNYIQPQPLLDVLADIQSFRL